MNQFNLGQFLTKVAGFALTPMNSNPTDSAIKNQTLQEIFSQNLAVGKQNQPPQIPAMAMNFQNFAAQNLQMNQFASSQKSAYLKDLMQMPQGMKDLVSYMQANLESSADLQAVLRNLNLIDMDQVALMIQKNGKEALNKLVQAMSNAAKQGITNLGEIKELTKLINASISMASQENPAQTIKSLLLLYLPWLPLKEETGYELEVDTSEEKSEASENYVTVMISTKNHGRIKALIIGLGGNFVSVTVDCAKIFPKEELAKRLQVESEAHSIKLSIIFEETKDKSEDSASPQARVVVFNSNKINPYLLLTSNALIRNIIDMTKDC